MVRLNWILHFGKPPRFLPNVKIVQLDFHAEEFGTNMDTTTSIFLKGDIQLVTQQLVNAFMGQNIKVNPQWWSSIKEKAQTNVKMVQELKSDSELPLNYYRAFAEVEKFLPPDCYLVSEGANTMDIGRGVIRQRVPRHRLDAGTFGTMGVGLGFAIAAQIANPNKRVVCIEGDSAFGFSGMEIETCARYKLPIVFIIFNNNGIFSGLDKDSFTSMQKDGGKLMSNVLLPNANYEKLADAFQCKGRLVQTPDELHAALKQAFSENVTWIINILINPYGTRKPQVT
jgi:2-hydroxyacyl-CoA lyase 1